MKKLILTAAFTLVGLGFVEASEDKYPAPSADTDQQISIEYGGTKYSTATAFNQSHVTATVNTAVFQNVNFSIGFSTDFVDVWDATSAVTTADTLGFRFYNNERSTGVANGGTSSFYGNSGPAYPIRMKKGIVWKPSSANYNSIFLQYWKPGKDAR